jgi:Phosphotransferase enzyme family
MTAAIASHHPDATVADITILTIDDGTNRRARFGLNYVAGSGPASVFLKAHAPGHRIVHLRNGNLFNEARLFASGMTLPVDHPLVYKAIVDYLRLDFLLVMEDLARRSADPRDATRPMTVDQVANGLRGLARLHSQYWGLSGKTHPQLRWVKTWKPTKGWQVGLRKRIPIGLERGAQTLPAAILNLDGNAIVDLWSGYVGTLATGPMTLLHGDAHIGNTYVLPDGDVGFLDWQVLRRGNWSQDVGYFLVSALTEEDRRNNERTLLEVYRSALEVPQDQLPTVEQAWLQYRAAPAYGLAIWLSTLGTDGWQSREISLTLAQRFAAAFVELDSLSVLHQIAV